MTSNSEERDRPPRGGTAEVREWAKGQGIEVNDCGPGDCLSSGSVASM